MPTSGGWADLLVNGMFTTGPPTVWELQIVHRKLMTVRQDLGAHEEYASFRSSGEIMSRLLTAGFPLPSPDTLNAQPRYNARLDQPQTGSSDVLTQWASSVNNTAAASLEECCTLTPPAERADTDPSAHDCSVEFVTVHWTQWALRI